jgi:L-histidine N-alpha-methyltransferase
MKIKTITQTFAADVYEGLTGNPKSLMSKYFYDDEGSRIFQKIMRMPEYYPTDCEYEIFDTKADDILRKVAPYNEPFDLIELGAGDGMKTKLLLSHFLEQNADVNYMPVDISEEAMNLLTNDFKLFMPDLNITPFVGDFNEALSKIQTVDNRKKVYMFLGSTIGNFPHHKAIKFFRKINSYMSSGDMFLVGFDLKKSPEIVLPAYDDPHGHTADFNLNLLTRMNRELGADFNLNNFSHYAVYDPISGSAKSYLISQDDQKVYFKEFGEPISFAKWEPIFMEISQKYDMYMIKRFAGDTNFAIIDNFYDSKNYFVNSLWEAK